MCCPDVSLNFGVGRVCRLLFRLYIIYVSVCDAPAWSNCPARRLTVYDHHRYFLKLLTLNRGFMCVVIYPEQVTRRPWIDVVD